VGAARAELKKQWIDDNDGGTPLYGWRRARSDVRHAAGRAVARSHPTVGLPSPAGVEPPGATQAMI
jgi:hypothetical protein